MLHTCYLLVMLEPLESPRTEGVLFESSMSSSNTGESLLAVSLGRLESDLLDPQRLKVLPVSEGVGRMGHCKCVCVCIYYRICYNSNIRKRKITYCNIVKFQNANTVNNLRHYKQLNEF